MTVTAIECSDTGAVDETVFKNLPRLRREFFLFAGLSGGYLIFRQSG